MGGGGDRVQAGRGPLVVHGQGLRAALVPRLAERVGAGDVHGPPQVGQGIVQAALPVGLAQEPGRERAHHLEHRVPPEQEILELALGRHVPDHAEGAGHPAARPVLHPTVQVQVADGTVVQPDAVFEIQGPSLVKGRPVRLLEYLHVLRVHKGPDGVEVAGQPAALVLEDTPRPLGPDGLSRAVHGPGAQPPGLLHPVGHGPVAPQGFLQLDLAGQVKKTALKVVRSHGIHPERVERARVPGLPGLAAVREQDHGGRVVFVPNPAHGPKPGVVLRVRREQDHVRRDILQPPHPARHRTVPGERKVPGPVKPLQPAPVRAFSYQCQYPQRVAPAPGNCRAVMIYSQTN